MSGKKIFGEYAAIELRGRVWRWCYMRHGVHHRQSLGIKDERQARRILARRDAEILAGNEHATEKSRVTVLDAVNRYAEHCKHLRASTRVIYFRAINKITRDAKYLDGIDRAAVETFLASGVRPATVQKNYRSLRAFFRWAVKAKLVSENPCDGIRLPKIETRLCRYLEPAEVKKILSEADRHRNGILVWLCYYAGLRISEAFHVRAEDVDWRRCSLRVRGWGDWSPKTHIERAVPLHSNLADKISKLGISSGPLVVSDRRKQKQGRKGLGFSLGAAMSLCNRIAAATGIDWSWHDLRHTFAERLLKNGTSLYHVSRLMGHQSIQTTEKNYGWLTTENLSAPMEAL